MFEVELVVGEEEEEEEGEVKSSLGDWVLETRQARGALAETTRDQRDETRRPMLDEPNARRRVRVLVGVEEPRHCGQRHRDEYGHEYAAQHAADTVRF